MYAFADSSSYVFHVFSHWVFSV